jgi:hypothetical protein
MDLSIIIVSYNVRDYLKTCLLSLHEATEALDREIIVFDNASIDGSVEMVMNEFKGVKLIRSNENLGFSKANNRAAKECKGEYILFLNPDTKVIEDAIYRLVEFYQNNGDCGIVGPALYNNDQMEWQPSIGRFLNPFLQIVSFLPLSKYYMLEYSNPRLINNEKTMLVDYLWGAALLIRNKLFIEAGLFDENMFMFGEDLDLCFKVHKLGYKVYYYPKAKIIHYYGKSLSKNSKKRYGLVCKSKFYWLRNNYNPMYFKLFRILLIQLLKIKIFAGISPHDKDYKEILQILREM